METSENYIKIAQLIAKETCSELNAGEQIRLNDWLAEDLQHKIIYARLKEQNKFSDWKKQFDQIEHDTVWDDIQIQINHSKIHTLQRFLRKNAAVLLLPLVLGSIGLLLLWKNSSTEKLLPNDFLNSTLVLANGDVIDLFLLSTDSVINESIVFSPHSGTLIYSHKKNLSERPNTLLVPRGKECRVKLADNTLIHLNSETKLSYFTGFSNQEKRQVKLSGEALFEVSKNPQQPFVVSMKGQDIEVLGTTFNIKAYDNDPTITTTLVEGKVKINFSNKKHASILLSPGQQARWTHSTNNITVGEVSTCQYTSWRDGVLGFRGERLEDIMISLSRWYNLEAEFIDSDLKDERFGGVLRRQDSIDSVIRNFEATNKVKVTRVGNKIIFSQK